VLGQSQQVYYGRRLSVKLLLEVSQGRVFGLVLFLPYTAELKITLLLSVSSQAMPTLTTPTTLVTDHTTVMD